MSKRELIAFLEFAITLGMFLDGIIGEVNTDIFHRFLVSWVSGRRCSDVSFLEKEDFELVSEKNPNSYIKFPAIKKEWLFKVFLDYKRINFEPGNRRHFTNSKGFFYFGGRFDNGTFCHFDLLSGIGVLHVHFHQILQSLYFVKDVNSISLNLKWCTWLWYEGFKIHKYCEFSET